jgi:hypothetical protein
MSLMTRCIFFTSVVVLIVALVLAFAPQKQLLQAEVAYCYDSVTTLSKTAPNANCFSVSSTGKFSKVYSSAASPSTLSSDVKRGGHVIPGLWDGHGHLLQYGELLQSVNIFGSKSLDEVTERVNHYAHKHTSSGSPEEWIRGTGWDQAAFGRMPTAVSPSSPTSQMGETCASLVSWRTLICFPARRPSFICQKALNRSPVEFMG